MGTVAPASKPVHFLNPGLELGLTTTCRCNNEEGLVSFNTESMHPYFVTFVSGENEAPEDHEHQRSLSPGGVRQALRRYSELKLQHTETRAYIHVPR